MSKMGTFQEVMIVILLAGVGYLTHRLYEVVSKVESMARDIELIRTNELYHLNQKIDELISEFVKLREFVLSRAK